MSKLPKLVGSLASTIVYLALTSGVFAQSSTSSASKGGTSGSLPSAGTTEITYAIFIAGVLLFVFGTLKLVASFREN